jgi:Cu/Ag efflux protein CusF
MKVRGMRSKLLTTIALATAVLAAPALAQSDKPVTGTGTVKKVDPAKKTMNLSHGPIPAINWPAMTMDFAVAPEVDLSAVKPGQAIEFTLKPGPGKDYTITEVKPKG